MLTKRKFCSTKCYHENYNGRKINRVNKKKVLKKKICVVCQSVFVVSKGNVHQNKKRACSKKCQEALTRLWLTKNVKGKRIYSPEEQKRRSLESGRNSYQKHKETRLFYYRQLAAIRKGIKGKFTKEEWSDVLQKQKSKCTICKIQMLKPTIDHKIPISKWELWKQTHPVNYECNDIQNIQALCSPCNIRKSNKI